MTATIQNVPHNVNTFCIVHLAKLHRMFDSQAERLQWARKRAGYESAAAFARAKNLNEVTYRAHESGNRGIPASRAFDYARALKVGASWILYGEGQVDRAPSIQVLGALMDDGFVEIYDKTRDKRFFGPGELDIENAVAIDVRTLTYYPTYYHGDVLFGLWQSRNIKPTSVIEGPTDNIIMFSDHSVCLGQLLHLDRSQSPIVRIKNHHGLISKKIIKAASILWIRHSTAGP